MSEITFLVYRNRFNEVKAYEVELIAEDGDYCDVYDMQGAKIKTFKKGNIHSFHNSFNEAISEAKAVQSSFKLIPRNKTGRTFANPGKKFEVCFTGFAKSEKEQLIKLAEENEMFVRTSVSHNLGLLVCGENAGWSKLKKANKMRVPRVFGIDGFHDYLETGEFAE
tara:strand:+ start:185 stop:682 length:498 start_codon:yes stop_codon:yes gene_type:complete